MCATCGCGMKDKSKAGYGKGKKSTAHPDLRKHPHAEKSASKPSKAKGVKPSMVRKKGM